MTKAVVLDKEWRGGEADTRYALFTERYGKISVRAKSSRKIVSKLAGHLEPGMVASVRIIEQHGAQIVDALKIMRLTIPLASLASLNAVLGEWTPDEDLWREFRRAAKYASTGAPGFLARSLAVLGWDPRAAQCITCNVKQPSHFHVPRQEFFCESCVAASPFVNDQVILIS